MATLHALSYVCAGYEVDLVTLGAPMVGNASFVKVMENAGNPEVLMPVAAGGDGSGGGGSSAASTGRGLLQACRLVNHNDPVPRAPSEHWYAHFPANTSPNCIKLGAGGDSVVRATAGATRSLNCCCFSASGPH